MKVRAAFLLALFSLAACGQPASYGNDYASEPSASRNANEAPTTLDEAMVPVRVGERGPAFAACAGRGATRDPAGAEPVPVRAAPFEVAAEIDRLPAGASFFICQRTHDQRWSGIVYDEGGQASERCGVSAPTARRRNYAGPCAAGWVPSARVRLVSGEPHLLPENAVAPAQ